MTAQISDSMLYAGEHYAIAAFSDGDAFSPVDAGYRPVMASTACWNGYLCGYELRNDMLYLADLWINHQARKGEVPGQTPPPPLNGIAAVESEFSLVGRWHFCDVALPLSYSGGILVGRDFIDALYVRMGHHPAWKYARVHELLFEQGRMVEVRDLSDEMARLRVRAREQLRPEKAATLPELAEWVAACFSQDYIGKSRRARQLE